MNIPLGDSGKPQDSLYLKTPVTPEEAFQAIGRLRAEARAEIDRLIGFLDKTDDYVSRELEDDDDREPVGDDEPSLCGISVDDLKPRHCPITGAAYPEDGEQEADAEPSLGSIGDTHHYDQERWATGGTKDLEDEHDGAEPDEGGEPSLGSLDAVMNQERSWHRENPYSVDLEQGE